MAVVAVVVGGLAAGASLAWWLGRGGAEVEAPDAEASASRAELVAALAAAGTVEPITSCSAATIVEVGTVRSAIDDPLAPGGMSREAVAACTRDHLADIVIAEVGLAETDALCVAGEVLERVGLELVLVSLDALAVTEEVRAAVAAGASACAPD